MDEIKLAISLPEFNVVQHGNCILLDDLSEEHLLDSSFDTLFISGLLSEDRQALSELCDKIGTDFVVVENPSNDSAAIHDVIMNIVGKLYADEMPNNIDVVDIRNLNECSDILFAFHTKSSALDFLNAQELGDLVGGVYLGHGKIELSEYEATNKALLNHFSDNGYLCSSLYGLGHSECTILLGIKR